MSPRTAPSAALPIAHFALRALVVMNILMIPVILVLLFIIPTERWIMSALEIGPSAETTRLVFGLRLIAVLGLVAIPPNHLILRRLLEIVETVRSGDPFVGANAARLSAVAWWLLSLQLLGLVIDAIADAIAIPGKPLDIDAGFSLSGWLAVLLVFLLSRVFAEGTRMRDEIAGTV